MPVLVRRHVPDIGNSQDEKAPDARLSGWEGPSFPTGIGHVHGIYVEIYQDMGLQPAREWLSKALALPSHTSVLEAPHTDDAYAWGEGRCYKLPCATEVAVLFPAMDRAPRRHAAVYLRGPPVVELQLRVLMEELFHAIED